MSTFTQGTKNYEIFNLCAPYANPYQGPADRWLFVCSAGLLRSPTGAALAIQKGYNARSCGSHINFALIPITANLIMWADKICFVSQPNYDRTLETFYFDVDFRKAIKSKAVILDIEDNYDYMQPELIKEFETQLFNPPAKTTATIPATTVTPTTITSIAESPAVALAAANAVEAPVAPVATV
jgi:predicted protein tyrosine phosphatase